MEFSLKKQFDGYQAWINIADHIELSEYSAINRYKLSSFVFVFVGMLLASYIYFRHNVLLSSFALFMHTFLGLSTLKADAVVSDALEAILNYKKLNSNVARFLNREYSLFLVSNGKKPLSEDAINNLEVHTRHFIDGKISRGGRSDSIRRFRIGYLKSEKRFLKYLFGSLIALEILITL